MFSPLRARSFELVELVVLSVVLMIWNGAPDSALRSVSRNVMG